MQPADLGARVLHTMLHVTDMERALGFYRDVLGMEVLVARENEATGHRNVFLGFAHGQGGEIELTSYRDRAAYDHGDAYGHVGVGVADCAAACAYFAERGVRVTRAPKTMPSGAVIAFIQDPDGYAIELIQPAAR